MRIKKLSQISILSIALGLMLLGVLWQIYRGSALHSFTFMHLGWQDANARSFERSFGILLAILGVLGVWKKKRITLTLLFLMLLGYSWAIFWDGGQHFPELSMFAQSSRWAMPMLLLLIVTEKQKGFGVIAKMALSLTFASHGWEAVQQHPVFIDYIISFSGMRISQGSAELLLLFIGLVDLIAAILIWTQLEKYFLLWMIAWGFATALIRIWDIGITNVSEFLVRIPHFVLPYILLRTQIRYDDN